MIGDPIVLVNRTTRVLKFTADSRHYELKPGDNYGFLQGHARLAQSQNPLMGSEDYYTTEFESLVGIKGETPCDPISDEDLVAAEQSIERFDRKANGMREGVKTKPRHAMPRGRGPASLANENSFAVNRA